MLEHHLHRDYYGWPFGQTGWTSRAQDKKGTDVRMSITDLKSWLRRNERCVLQLGDDKLVPTLITLVRLRPHDKFVTFPGFKKFSKKNLEIQKILLFARVYIIYSNSFLRILKFKLRIKASKRIVYILLHAREFRTNWKSTIYKWVRKLRNHSAV